MVAIKALTLLALAGASIAAPVAQPLEVGEALVRREAEPQRGGWGGQRANYSWRYGWGRPQGQSQSDQPSDDSSSSQPAQPTQPQPEASQPEQPEQPSGGNSSPPAAAPSSGSDSGSSSGGSSGSTGYMAIVDEWRSKMGMSALQQDSTLQSNAQNAADSTGGQLIHKLNPGSMAQVMAPGNTGNFESVFVGGWLCELPNLPGLGSSVCNAASQGWNHAGQTGHAEILSSTKYSKIGCALGDGIWSCDLA